MASNLIQFEPEVCTRLHTLFVTIARSESARSKAFKDRDGLEVEINECSAGEEERQKDLKELSYDAQRKIRDMSITIKWATGQILETIGKADQPELFGKDVRPKPPKELFEPKKSSKADEPDEPEAKDEEPVKTKTTRAAIKEPKLAM